MRFELNVENQNVFLNFENNWCSLSVDVGFEAHLMIFVNRHVSNRYLANVFNDFEFQIEPSFLRIVGVQMQCQRACALIDISSFLEIEVVQNASGQAFWVHC